MQGGCYRSKCFYSHDLSNVGVGGVVLALLRLNFRPFARPQIRCTYFDKGLCIKGDACPFMHDEALDEIRQALPWLVPLMAHGQPEFLVQVAAPYFSDAKHEAPQNQDNAAEAPELSSAEAFPPLHEGIPLIAMAADSEAASDWSGAKHIAFRQVTNAFCNSLVGQDEGSLLRVFDDCGGNIKKTFETLLSEGCRPNKQWLRQEYEKHYLGQRAAKFSSQPPPVPDIAWVETGATVGAAYAKLREEATNLAKLRNRCLQQVGVGGRRMGHSGL